MQDQSEQLLKLGQEAGGFYATLNWNSPKIQRICFSAMTSDPMELTGGQLESKIEQLARNIPYSGAPPSIASSYATSRRRPTGNTTNTCRSIVRSLRY